ncbi:MAG: hypothetical protein AB8B56_05845 [Crocinitomicaceae bacterium]
MKKSLKEHFKTVLLLSVLGLLLSCSDNDVRFHELSSLRFELEADSTAQGQFAEYYVIENCPKQHKELVRNIEEFNSKTLKANKIEEKKPAFYSRYFYRESRDLSRSYKEDESYFSDVIEDHIEDLVATIEYSEKKGWLFRTRTLDSIDHWEHHSFQ